MTRDEARRITVNIAKPPDSFDDFVGSREQFRRNGEAERFRCFEIDGQFEFGRLNYRQVGGLSPLRMRPV